MTILLLAIPLVASFIALAQFVLQGGVGGGHGKYDSVIFFLQCPGILALDVADKIRLLDRLPDFVSILLLPWLLNSFLFGLIGVIVDTLRRRRQSVGSAHGFTPLLPGKRGG